MTKPTVFISSSTEGLNIAREISRQLGTTAVATRWSEAAFHVGKTAVESLTEAADRSDFAIFILTADDMSTIRGDQWSPRPNLIFELGFLAGRIGLERTFIVVDDVGRIALPTDLAGTMYIGLSRSGAPDLVTAVAPAVSIIQRTMAEINTRQERSIEYYSCFLSYAWKDKEFAVRLHDDLQDVGIRCWLDAKKMKVGDKLSNQIDRAIQAHDKVLLVLSQASIQSAWVRLEVKHALQLEHDRQKTVLFPIRLDDSVLSISGNDEIEQLKEKYIGDFSQWQEKSSYQRSFSRLVRDLAISASVESGRKY